MELTLYSTGCPKCNVLKKKLDAKGIRYKVVDDLNKITATGFMSVPLLEVEGKVMLFNDAVEWVNNYDKGEEQNG